MSSLKPVTFRLRPEVHARLREMSELADRPMVEIVSAAIDRLWEANFRGSRAEADERADQAVALVRKLEARLGERFWREHGASELGFAETDDGRPIVVVGEFRYLEDTHGQLVRAHARGGHLLLAPIDEEGEVGDPMAVPVGEPALN